MGRSGTAIPHIFTMISVCIATYNGSKYIKEQLQSILKQLGEEDEIIISDDGSTDDTVNIIRGIEDPRIILLHHKKNVDMRYVFGKGFRYATNNFENALKEAKGKYIFLSDQDDVWHTGKVSKMLQALKVYDLVQCNCNIIGTDGIEIQSFLFHSDPFSSSLFGNLKSMPFLGCCIAFRRDVLNWVLPFPKGLLAHDFWVGAIASQKGKIVFLPEVLHAYRKHMYNVSPASGKSSNPLIFKITYRIILLFQLITRLYKLNHR